MEKAALIDEALRAHKKIHCVGIGGIGLSALARYFKASGYNVQGSDAHISPITEGLDKEGVTIYTGHDACNISSEIGIIFHSAAIPKDNVELVRARELGILCFTYAEGLGYISRNKKTIAIAGTHGKTTTTAMVAKVLQDAGLDPTVIVGSLLSKEGTNCIIGSGEYFVVEACEYNRSFLALTPTIAVITNIDNDHLDYYGSLDGIIDGFYEFTQNIVSDGYLVVNTEAKNIDALLSRGPTVPAFDYVSTKELNLSIPGKHMQENAKAALAVGRLLDVNEESMIASLESFTGTWRRSEYKGKTDKGVRVYDDYGHHPTEIKTTLQGFRDAFPDVKIAVVFQPHLYSRTKNLFNDFVESFDSVSFVYVAPIYAAREPYDDSIHSQMLIDALVAKGVGAEPFTDIFAATKNLQNNDIVLTIGAGPIYKEGEKLLHDNPF